MHATHDPTTHEAASLRSRNLRTALVLLSIAAVFFVGFIAAQYAGGAATGIIIMGSVVLLFLVVAIGRNLRGKP
jgi:Zn-dependent membrane protease YugP